MLDHYPFIRLFTADALFTERPLAKVLLEADRDFLFTVKDNQPGLLEAILTSLGDASQRAPDAKTVEKKGMNFTPASSGWWKGTRQSTSAKPPGSLASQ